MKAIVIFKVIFIGEGGVGKTSLLKRHTEGYFDESMILTVGVDFAVQDVSRDNWRATLQIWDLGGQIRFRDFVIHYFNGARAAVAVFDITAPYTLERLSDWITRLLKVEQHVPLVIVGNKIDLRNELLEVRKLVTSEEGKTFAGQYNAPYVETSAKSGEGVDIIFSEITRLLAERYPQPEDISF
ncbi:MAG: Rab family GTPase [Promethearchaeota archaeon]